MIPRSSRHPSSNTSPEDSLRTKTDCCLSSNEGGGPSPSPKSSDNTSNRSFKERTRVSLPSPFPLLRLPLLLLEVNLETATPALRRRRRLQPRAAAPISAGSSRRLCPNWTSTDSSHSSKTSSSSCDRIGAVSSRADRTTTRNAGSPVPWNSNYVHVHVFFRLQAREFMSYLACLSSAPGDERRPGIID